MKVVQRALRLYRGARYLDAVLEMKDREVQEWQRIALEANRSVRDVAVAFRIALEQPEIDLREDVDAMIRNMDDHIAKMEEHTI